jgi:hypothetical protein
MKATLAGLDAATLASFEREKAKKFGQSIREG